MWANAPTLHDSSVAKLILSLESLETDKDRSNSLPPRTSPQFQALSVRKISVYTASSATEGYRRIG
jgi:hypothetical protein